MKKSAFIQLMIVFVFAGITLGSDIRVASKDVNYSCQISQKPELGNEFSVTVTFSFDEKTYYLDDDASGAKANISIFWPQEYISGDTLISGNFDKGETYTISAAYRVIKSGTCYISLNIITNGEADASGQRLKDSYTNTTLFCGEYFIEPTIPSAKTLILDSSTGLKITSQADMDSSKIPKPLTGKAVVLPSESNTTDSIQVAKKGDSVEEMTNMGVQSPIPNIIYLLQENNQEYLQVKNISIDRNKECRLIFKDSNTRRILQPSFLDGNNDFGKIEKLDDSIYIFIPIGKESNIILEGLIENKAFELRLDISSSWLLEGIFKYTDPYGNMDNRLEFVTLYVSLATKFHVN